VKSCQHHVVSQVCDKSNVKRSMDCIISVVTGSSKGIGKAIAMEFANAGAMQDFISQGIIL
jgi:hypothetical protein